MLPANPLLFQLQVSIHFHIYEYMYNLSTDTVTKEFSFSFLINVEFLLIAIIIIFIYIFFSAFPLACSVGNGVGTNVQLSGGPVTTSGGGTNEPTIVNVVGRLGTLTTNQGSHQQQQQQQQQIHLSSHHIVTPSVTQLHVAQAGTTATMIGGTPITTAQLGGQGGGTQVLQQVVAQTPGGGHQLVHMVLHHHGGNGQGNGAANAVSLGGTLQIGGTFNLSQLPNY